MHKNHKQIAFKAGGSFKQEEFNNVFVVERPKQRIDHRKLSAAIGISADVVDPCNVCVNASGYCSDCPICHGLDCQVISATH